MAEKKAAEVLDKPNDVIHGLFSYFPLREREAEVSLGDENNDVAPATTVS